MRIDFYKASNDLPLIIIFLASIALELLLSSFGITATAIKGILLVVVTRIVIALLTAFFVYRLSGKEIKFATSFNILLFFLILTEIAAIIPMAIAKLAG